MFAKLYDTWFRIHRIAGRLLIKYSSNPRPDSAPFITGDGFRSMADHIFDEVCPNFDPSKVKGRDVVFIAGYNNIKKFLREFHPEIRHPYILVSHNGDDVIDEEAASLMDSKILKWYGVNVLVKDPRIIPLPIGMANKHFYVEGIPSVFRKIMKKKIVRQNKIFYGFTATNNTAERQPALDALKKNSLAETVIKWTNFPTYLNLLATYKFVASPPGTSVEGHRTWDALYIGIVPIVKSSITIDYFKSLNIPLWVIHGWNELDGITEQELQNKFDALRSNLNEQALYLDYWTKKIRNIED